ncbi:MAG: hypothetical protein NC938_07045 [Candidatus Omnitrophica bacterium]|nr:hypothetical protein [Candidatus Omnitrophota bacterium]MCM8791424.1 hypothetical protein [Candidatus Omnitrophota bacterium]
MPIRKMLLLGLTALLIATGLIALTCAVTSAQGPASQGEELLAKINEILANQKDIIEDLAAIKEELRIIKIRVTQQL